MARMTEDTFSVLYDYGKQVYKGEMSVDVAAQKANQSNPEVAVSSARHYINWYSKMRNGEILTWNTNIHLLEYYVKRIIEEEGLSEGKTAINAAKKYAEHAHRDELNQLLGGIEKEYGIDPVIPTTEWWPSLDEYDPGFSKDDWVKMLSDPEIIGPIWGQAIAMFYTEKEGASCKTLSEKFGINANTIRSNCTQLAMSIHKKTGCLLANHGNKDQYWPILFVGRTAASKETGAYIWKIRPVLYDALTEVNILRFLPKTEPVHPTGVFDSWEILNEHTAVKHCDKSFFDYKGSAISKDIYWFFNAENLGASEKKPIVLMYENQKYSGHVICGSSEHRSTRIFWDSELSNKLAAFKSHTPVKAVFSRSSDSIYTIEIKEDKDPGMDVNESLSIIKQYISCCGFTFPDGLIDNFYLSLKSKPFVILAGTSGTGKTRLVKLFAEAIGAEYKMVPVRPDWSDGSDLFGHYDLNGNFIPGPVCDAFDAAFNNPSKPVLLCLDEMNLARVEYYLSDFLSVIESREKDDLGGIFTSSIAQYEGIPENLYIIGTVNMDETTFPFSKKVLDRANTIEFSYVELMPRFSDAPSDMKPLELQNDFLKTEYLILETDCADEQEFVSQICTDLQTINDILVKANAHVGYRVRDEIVFYMLNNKNAGELLSYEQAFDNEIMQKILPRIQGSSTSIKDMLVELFKYCMGDYSGLDTESRNVGNLMQTLASKGRYKESAKKIGYMMTRFEEDGFTSYWL